MCFCGQILMCSSVIAMQHAAVSLSLSLSLSVQRKPPHSYQQTLLQCLRVREGGRERARRRERQREREREGEREGVVEDEERERKR